LARDVVAKPGSDVGQFARLLGNGLNHPRILMAEIDAHQLRRKIQIALACGVHEVAAFGIDDMQRLPGLLDAPGAVVRCAGDVAGLLCGQFRTGKNIAHA
jgi:hypothetical protein